MKIGGISEEGMRCGGLFAVLRWNDEIEGLVLSGGDGIPGNCGVVIASIGVTCPEKGSLGSATEGDCSGDCIVTCLVFADASIMRGGRRGVVAKFSSKSALTLFAFSISIGVEGIRSSRLSKLFGGYFTKLERCQNLLLDTQNGSHSGQLQTATVHPES